MQANPKPACAPFGRIDETLTGRLQQVETMESPVYRARVASRKSGMRRSNSEEPMDGGRRQNPYVRRPGMSCMQALSKQRTIYTFFIMANIWG